MLKPYVSDAIILAATVYINLCAYARVDVRRGGFQFFN